MTCNPSSSAAQADFDWILLQRLGVNAAAVRRAARVGDPLTAPARLLHAEPDGLARLGVMPAARERITQWQRQGRADAAAVQAQRDLDWLAANGARLLHLADPGYPMLLQEIADPPPWLYVAGDASLLERPQLAVVGSRRPSRQGLEDAGAFAAELARAGFTITSGLAYGIDAAAHRAALAVGGTTIAVLGTGLDVVYPARHAELAAAVRAQGALVAEQPLGTRPLARHFPRRNRIISGLGVGVLVVEAALRSGSLVTARLALEQNREVFALPGSIHNPAARGCNALIRQGATLVQTVADIGEQLAGWSGGPVAACSPQLPASSVAGDEAAVLAAIGHEPTSFDLILERAGLPAGTVMAALAELELGGAVAADGGGWARLAQRQRLG